MLFTGFPDVTLQDSSLVFPAKPSTQPSPDVIPIDPVPEVSIASAQISIRAATCNVLTLKSKANQATEQFGLAGPARQDWILETFHRCGLHIFGLQETRLRKLIRHFDARYVLIKSPATSQGHFGMMLGLS